MINKIKISFCRNYKDNKPILKELTKEELELKLTTFDNKIINKHEVPAFVGGYFDGKGRKNENLLARTLITLDMDNYNGSISDLEAFLDNVLNKYGYIAHSTSNHIKDKPKIRIVLFPNKEIKPNEYEDIVINFCERYSISEFIDKSCAMPAQIMYLPIKTNNDYMAWIKTNKGEAVDIDLFTSRYDISNIALSNKNYNDNFDFIALKPTCNLSDEEVRDYLKCYDVSKTNYSMWRDVGMALHHQYSGSNKGKELFVEWSCQDIRPKYEDKAKVRKTAEIQYDSFKLDKTNLITFRSIVYKVKQKTKINWQDIKKNGMPLSTIQNYRLLFNHYGINPTYNIIKKREITICPDFNIKVNSPDIEGDKFNEIHSLCILHGLSKDEKLLRKYLSTTAHQNSFNPIKDILGSIKHDGIKRLSDFYSIIKVLPQYENIKNIYLKKWLMQFLFMTCFNDRKKALVACQVLVLQGKEGIGKTTFLKELLPLELREYFDTVAAVDLKNDMQVKNLIEHAIIEFGELPATFRKSDNDVFKAFITKSEDKINIKYQANHGIYRRNTTFVASVNDTNFLNPNHENTRLLVIPVLSFDWNKKVDILQLYAELLIEAQGEIAEKDKKGQNLESIYELTQKEKALQKQVNKEFEEPRLFEELLKEYIDWSASTEKKKRYSTTEICKHILPPNYYIKQSDLNACGAALRKLGLEPDSKKKYEVVLIYSGQKEVDFEEKVTVLPS